MQSRTNLDSFALAAAWLLLSIPAAADTDVLDRTIAAVQEVCRAPADQASHWKVEGSARVDGQVRVKLLGIVGAGVDASFTGEEWNGVQQVLREQQASDNKNYRECVKAILPLILDRFFPERPETPSISQNMLNSPGASQTVNIGGNPHFSDADLDYLRKRLSTRPTRAIKISTQLGSSGAYAANQLIELFKELEWDVSHSQTAYVPPPNYVVLKTVELDPKQDPDLRILYDAALRLGVPTPIRTIVESDGLEIVFGVW